MYIAMNRFKVMKGAESAFEHVWLSRDTHLDRVPGFVEFHLLRGPERDDHVLYSSHTVWASKDAFTAWTQSEHFRAAHRDAGANKPLYLGHPEFEGFEVLQTIKNSRGMRPPEAAGPCKSSPAPSAVRATRSSSTMSASRRRGPSRPPRSATPTWADYLWFNANPKGVAREIWLHLTCMEMFVMTRDTALNATVAADAAARGAMSGLRLPSGGGVDRGRRCVFTFDGKPYVGFEGDSIASALLANGVGIVGRSFKYHRPRGIWGAWTEEPNAIVDVTRGGVTTPNLRATTEALENDLAVRSVNAAPTAAADRAASARQGSRRSCRRASITRRSSGRGGRLTKARFAPWPASAGSMPTIVRRPTIRRSMPVAISLSSAPDAAGLAAANAAALAGRTVFLVDDHAEIGGQLVHRGGTIEGGELAGLGASVARTIRSRRRPGDDANDGLWRLRRQSRLRLGAAGAAGPTRCGASGQNKSSSRPARSSGRSSSPTTTGRA